MRRAVLAVVMVACGDRSSPPDAVATVEVAVLPAVVTRELDLLFVLQDSPGMAEKQVNLAAHVAVLFDSLTSVDGALPSMHIGMVSSDMGTTGSLDPSQPGPAIGQANSGGCSGHGKDGALLSTGAPIVGGFLVDERQSDGTRTRNYAGVLEDVVTTMLRIGGGGCGFEQHLAALRRSLANDLNAGFLRPAANLAIVILGDEDDCSVHDAALLGPDSATLGPLHSFRCTRFGLTCDQDVNAVGTKTHCRPRTDSPYIDDVAPFTATLDGVKPRGRLAVMGVLGDRQLVTVGLRAPPGGGTAILALEHSCAFTSVGGVSAADPTVRLGAFLDHFGARGTFTTLCAEDLTPSLREIARVTKQMLGVACVDTSRLADPAQPRCQVELHTGTDAPAPIPACPEAADCYDLVNDAAACPETADHLRVSVRRAQPVTDADAYYTVRCDGL